MTAGRAALALGGLAALVLAAYAGATRWLTASCVNRTVAELPAPHGGRTAVVFRRDCGPTTAPATNVSIVGLRTPVPRGRGDLVIIAPEGAATPPAVRVQWIASDVLRVTYPVQARPYEKEDRVKGVRIVYQTY